MKHNWKDANGSTYITTYVIFIFLCVVVDFQNQRNGKLVKVSSFIFLEKQLFID